jgi:hypothetical protein
VMIVVMQSNLCLQNTKQDTDKSIAVLDRKKNKKKNIYLQMFWATIYCPLSELLCDCALHFIKQEAIIYCLHRWQLSILLDNMTRQNNVWFLRHQFCQ